MKYNVKFTRVIEGQIEASSLEEAAKVAREHVAQFSGRVGLLRGYGNAIVPQVAAAFIEATGLA